jgi:hypothetical protein
MMENWLGVSGEAPAARMDELVGLLRRLWRVHEGPVHHEGRFYRLHLVPTAGTPAPLRDHLPIWTAGLGPRMVRAAGRVADGLVCHPMTTPAYLDALVHPELTRGAADAGRGHDGFVVKGMRMCALDDDEERARRRVAFAIGQYAASRVYNRLFALHGWDGAQARIRAAAKEGDAAGMTAAVPDEAVDAIGIACRPADLTARAAAGSLRAGRARHGRAGARVPAARRARRALRRRDRLRPVGTALVHHARPVEARCAVRVQPSPGTDPYYADPALARSFLDAAALTMEVAER